MGKTRLNHMSKLCSAFTPPHCHHHGPQGKDPFPAEGATGCKNQESPACPKKCDAGSSATFKTDAYTFSGSTQSASGEEGIQKAIMAGGPVETAFTVYTDVANSWNPYWGEKGYFRIKRGGSECGIEDGVTFS